MNLKILLTYGSFQKNKSFNWKKIINEAKTKEMKVDPISIYEIINSFPANIISTIKWAKPIKESIFLKELSIIAEDILRGMDNSLYK